MKRAVNFLIVFLFMTVIFVGKDVHAKEIYYTNSKGVEFTKEQYDFYTDLTHDGFQEHVTQEMLDEISHQDISTIQKKVTRMCLNDSKFPKRRDDNTYVYTSAKELSMGQYCSNVSCRIITELDWLGEPNVKSYDLMGAYLDGPTLETGPATIVSSTTTDDEEVDLVFDSDGFGAIIQVPTGDEVIVAQTFTYTGTGTIFCSYQHATQGISLLDAHSFNIGLIGYGNVFDFYGNAIGVYDAMPGVCMDV